MVGGSRSNRKWLRIFAAGFLVFTIIGNAPLFAGSAAEAAGGPTFVITGDSGAKLTDPVVVRDGRMYAPAARVAALLGAEASWDGDLEEVTIRSAMNDRIVLGNGVPVVYFNDGRYRMEAPPFVKDGRLYAPLRQLAEMLHASVHLDADAGLVELNEVEPAAVDADSGLEAVAKAYGIGTAELLLRNGLKDETAVKAGMKLKVVVPSILASAAKPFTDADLMLLAKITMVEAGYESYEGQLGIANVILNRVKDPRFPNTIKGVIYAGKQFPPAHNGMLDDSKPDAVALRAAKDALNGKNNVDDALYFFNPKVTKGSFWSGLDVIVTIGSHSFAK